MQTHAGVAIEAADWLLVPAVTYCMTAEERRAYVSEVIEYISPLGQWDARPERHVWLFTSDHGLCGYGPGEEALSAVGRSVILSHYGLRGREPRYTPHGLDLDGQGAPCYNETRDVVIPYNTAHLAPLLDRPCAPYPKQPADPLLFFAGSDGMHAHKGIHYSHGVRQLLFKLWARDPRFKFVARAPDDNFDHAHFCLAPLGGGYGNRLAKALLHGCIPLIIQPGVTQAFEDALPYERFSLALEPYKLHRLDDILAYHAGDQERMRSTARAACDVRPAFVWEWDHRLGRAFEVLEQVLMARTQK